LRAVIQRVRSASVTVDGEVVASIGPGLLALVAVGKGDQESDVQLMANKLAGLRVFPDQDGKMNLDIQQVKASLLLVSQFTLYGDARKGNRPSFDAAELPIAAKQLFDALAENLATRGILVAMGKFQTHMLVELMNDGPITILLDSRKLF